MTRTIFWGGISIALIVLASLLLIHTQEETIVIGVSAPLSGDFSIIGQPLEQAMHLALEEAMLQHPSEHQFRLVFEDDQFRPNLAIATVNKLISQDNAHVIVTAGSPTGMAVAPLAQQHQIPHFGIASADVGGQGNMNFNHWTPPRKQAELLVQTLEEESIRTIALITLNHEGGMAVRDAVVDELDTSSIRIVGEELFTQGTTDFRTIWQKTLEQTPDVVFFVAQTPEFELLLRQRQELGITTPVVTIESPLYSEQPELFDGNWFVDAAAHSEEFVHSFEQHTGRQPFVFSGNAYDIVMLIVEIQSQFDEVLTAEQFVQAIHAQPERTGVMGDFIVDTDGTFLTEATIKHVQQGEIIS